MRRQNQHRHERGFTLTEIMVAMAIFTIIIIAALMLYDRSNRAFKTGVESAEMQQETRVAFDRLTRDVRMAGFDFDRDGVPVLAGTSVWTATTAYQQGRVVVPPTPNGFSYIAQNGGTSGASVTWPTTAGATVNDNGIVWRAQGAQFQQPDEQIEYAGLSAITIRGNLDYNVDVTNEHGRETAYEPAGGQFPIVTTGNDEIVTYALKSDAPGAANDDSITFFADVDRPRTAYPGGSAEDTVTISGIDLCNDSTTAPVCTNPPYTLYRYTIQADGQPDAGTPVARNIRSLKFFYYASATGRPDELLKKADGTAVIQGAIGGAGQYDPASVGTTTNFDDRNQRASIQAVRIELVGMNPQPDPRYTNPTEALSAFQKYRTYELESLIVPRNIGLTGMQEPSNDRPTPPLVRSVCVGYCNATRVTWDSPLSGEVIRYEIRYDSNATGGYTNVAANLPGDQLVGYINLPALPAGATQWYIKVRAVNEHGVTDSSNYLSGVPTNRTQPAAPSDLSATSTDTSTQQPNKITLTWPRVTANVSPLNTLSCTGAGAATDGSAIPPQETIRYRVWRGTTEDFDPTAGEGTLVLSEASPATAQPQIFPTTTTVTWSDDSTSLAGAPANCKTYYYRIQAYDLCALNASLNTPANITTGTSEIFPALDQPARPGSAGYPPDATAIPPSTPSTLAIDASATRCRFGTNNCEITMQWPKVLTDANGAAISVDRYNIERERKTAADLSWTADPLTPSPYFVENATLQPGTNVRFTDNTAMDHDGTSRARFYYRYRVRSEYCGIYSGYTNWVYYPEGCAAPSEVQPTGASSGDGLSDSSPWVMAAGDYINVVGPGSGSISRVDFDLVTHPGSSPVRSFSDDAAPYIFPWESLTDLEVYALVVTVTQSTGCVEQFVRYIQDQSGLCPEAVVTATGNSSGSGLELDPWVLNGADKITVAEPADAPFASVSFQLFDEATDLPIGSATLDNTTPFDYTWTDRTDNAIYRLAITVTYADLCTETRDFYIRDEVCSGATVTAQGTTSGDGLASTSPWEMGAGDTVTVTRPATSTPARVLFDLTPVNPAGTAESQVIDASLPFVYTWADRTDNTVYQLNITVVYSTGCQETFTRFIKDEPPRCTLTVDNPNGTILTSTGDLQLSLSLINTAPVQLTLQSIAITWTRPNQVDWDTVTFPSNGAYAINSSTGGTQTLTLNPQPSPLTPSDVVIPAAAGATNGLRTLLLNFSANGQRTMPVANITRICVAYKRADTGAQIFNCRILDSGGTDASPNNPTTCN